MQQVQYNKMSITLERNLRIVWKFGHRLILSISTEQSHKNSISKSQNGPLMHIWIEFFFFLLNFLYFVLFYFHLKIFPKGEFTPSNIYHREATEEYSPL